MPDHSIQFVDPEIVTEVVTASGHRLGEIRSAPRYDESGGTEYWFHPNLHWHMEHEVLDDDFPVAFEKDGDTIIYRDLEVLKNQIMVQYTSIIENLDLEEEEDDDLLTTMTMHNEEELED